MIPFDAPVVYKYQLFVKGDRVSRWVVTLTLLVSWTIWSIELHAYWYFQRPFQVSSASYCCTSCCWDTSSCANNFPIETLACFIFLIQLPSLDSFYVFWYEYEWARMNYHWDTSSNSSFKAPTFGAIPTRVLMKQFILVMYSVTMTAVATPWWLG